jgi:anti-sigma factor RsiW
MNCLACEELLQDRLDGAPSGAHDAALAGHLASCPACREKYAAASRLAEGLRLLAPPAPPVGMSRRVVAAVLAERRGRLRRQRWARVAVGLAAAVLVFVLLDKQRPQPAPSQPSQPEEVVAEAPSGSLRDSVTEASSAVVNLTRRTADETVGNTRLLLPVMVARAPTDEPPVPSPMDPPVRSLREAGQGLSAGLEPVTSSARRAFDLFLREVPPMEPDNKPGL